MLSEDDSQPFNIESVVTIAVIVSRNLIFLSSDPLFIFNFSLSRRIPIQQAQLPEDCFWIPL